MTKKRWRDILKDILRAENKGQVKCLEQLDGIGVLCTRPAGHTGYHVALSGLMNPDVWQDVEVEETTTVTKQVRIK